MPWFLGFYVSGGRVSRDVYREDPGTCCHIEGSTFSEPSLMDSFSLLSSCSASALDSLSDWLIR